MTFKRILIANRGEIAIRVARAANDLGFETVAVYSEDDAQALHVKHGDQSFPLKGAGPAAYLDGTGLIEAAKATNCDAVHPGYGFLSEIGDFARACEKADLVFIGPNPSVLDVFGDKARARALAQRFGVPILSGTTEATDLAGARAFFAKQANAGGIVIKALHGGGGRGMRIVSSAEQLEEAFARCQSEARAAFGSDAVYVEALLPNARHIDVQVAGDGKSAIHLWERDCSLQRRFQKIVEIAPAPGLEPGLRKQLCDAAVWLADDVKLRGLATFEFLVAPEPPRHGSQFAFIEANPRLQVEHTITEEITGIDLAVLQLELACDRSLKELGLKQDNVPKPRGSAIQLRINAERVRKDGTFMPSGGTIE